MLNRTVGEEHFKSAVRDFASPDFHASLSANIPEEVSPMPYAEGRTYNDAGSHIMETRD